MPEIPATVWISSAVCAVFFAWAGQQPNAPFFCRWPYVVWDLFAREQRRPAPVGQRPDYEKIALLERELGIVEPEPQQPIRPMSTVCLTKNCAGDTGEIYTWSGHLIARLHNCVKP